MQRFFSFLVYDLCFVDVMSFYSDIINLILCGEVRTKQDVHRAKIRLCKKYKFEDIPSDTSILEHIPKDASSDEKKLLVSVLRRKPMRSISGVAVVAVMTSPFACPHGRCIPCPGGPDICTPQSYTGFEPAAMRASFNNFDPFLQTRNRIEQLQAIGHPVDKIDFIVMGGTFTARDYFYQSLFVKRCLDGLNNSESKNLFEAQKKNEKAKSRCIGLTVETRPDWFRLRQIDESLNLGATRVELGVQTVYDDVLYAMNRGHSVYDSILAMRNAKNSGFKVCVHMMPGLPGSSFDRDIDAFRVLFEDDDFKPDMLKIYPTLTVEGTQLFEMWKNRDYSPLCTEDAARLIAQVKSFVPDWLRIQRIQRDIPADHIEAGVDKSNLRQIVKKYMKKRDLSCRCIRCREIGHMSLEEDLEFDEDDVRFDVEHYFASGSEEVFISLVVKKYDALIGFLRLRDINMSHRPELSQKPCMVIRELKVVGRELALGTRSKEHIQHQGYGKELIEEAEYICREEFDKKDLFVLSGIGVKEYYRRLGFEDSGVYLCKKL